MVAALNGTAHDTHLTGPLFAQSGASPVILRRTDREFLPAILNGLKTPEGRVQLAQSVAADRDANNKLKLYQPMHQIMYVALVQAFCETFGWPRLDAAKIDSCGLVIRRVSATAPNLMERWSKLGDQLVGWVPCNDDDLDPDPARRAPKVSSGNAEIDKRLLLPLSDYAGYSESVAALFPAPPEVCAAAKATLLYGLVAVTSTEKSEIAPAPVFENDALNQQIPYLLTVAGSRTKPPNAGSVVTGANAADPALAAVVTSLRQLRVQFGAFDDTPSPQSKALFQGLNQLSVTDAQGRPMAALGDFLRNASAVLLEQSGGSFTMPSGWAVLDQRSAAPITSLLKKALEARLASMLTGESRYEDPTSQYKLYAFARVKRPDGCPPELIWTAPSDSFFIAAWYDSSGLPPVKITLPSMDGLKKLKPNVAFAMPEALFNDLQRDPKKMVSGDPTSPGGMSLGLMWLCSFNIPVITICAFIVLNIFLSLFDLFLNWMLFIKICIPIPVPKKNG